VISFATSHEVQIKNQINICCYQDAKYRLTVGAAFAQNQVAGEEISDDGQGE
jgi:hypothetical protein